MFTRLLRMISISALFALALHSTFSYSVITTPTKADQETAYLENSISGYNELEHRNVIPEAYSQLLSIENLHPNKKDQLKFLGYQLFSEEGRDSCVLTGSFAIAFWINFYRSIDNNLEEYRIPNDIDVILDMDHNVSLASFFPSRFIDSVEFATNHAINERCHILGMPGYFGMDLFTKTSPLGFEDYEFFIDYTNADDEFLYYPVLPPSELLVQKKKQLERYQGLREDLYLTKIENIESDILILERLVTLQK